MFNEWTLTAVIIIATVAFLGGGAGMWKLVRRRSDKSDA
tara:strand:+ start:1252 stop:1368 length:117 start_codon:yes stop_codon:yes gene_type:complete